MTVAVVIPTWSAAEFIGRTLESVFEQTVPPDEVIVIDDASPDATVEIIEKHFRTAPCNTKLIRLEKNTGGPAAPLNRGIDVATSDWIVPLDHDDELVPDRIERLKNINVGGLVIGRLIVRKESQDRGHLLDTAWSRVKSLSATHDRGLLKIEQPAAYDALARFGCYAMSCSAMAFSKALWRDRGGFDESIATCIDFAFLENCLRDRPLYAIDAPVAYWTWRAENLSHDAPRRVFEVSTVMERIFDRRPEGLRRAMLERSYYLACRGRYNDALRLIRRAGWSTPAALKCFAKALQRGFR
jgi:glycosyltransferase involved in cell wall biosynthesis